MKAVLSVVDHLGTGCRTGILAVFVCIADMLSLGLLPAGNSRWLLPVSAGLAFAFLGTAGSMILRRVRTGSATASSEGPWPEGRIPSASILLSVGLALASALSGTLYLVSILMLTGIEPGLLVEVIHPGGPLDLRALLLACFAAGWLASMGGTVRSSPALFAVPPALALPGRRTVLGILAWNAVLAGFVLLVLVLAEVDIGARPDGLAAVAAGAAAAFLQETLLAAWTKGIAQAGSGLSPRGP